MRVIDQDPETPNEIRLNLLKDATPRDLGGDYPRVEFPQVRIDDVLYDVRTQLVESEFTLVGIARTDCRVNIHLHTTRKSSVDSQSAIIGPGQSRCVGYYESGLEVCSRDYLWPHIARIAPDCWGWDVSLIFEILEKRVAA